MEKKDFIKNVIVVLICVLLVITKAYLAIPVFLISISLYYIFLEEFRKV